MSILSTVADPAAAVIVTGIVGYVAHELGKIKIGKQTLSEDVEKNWPAVKSAAAQAQSLPGVAGLVKDLQTKVNGVPQTVEAEVAKQLGQRASDEAGVVASDVEAEVKKQIAATLSALAAAPAPVAPAAPAPTA